jgi:ricin-type beta-trefoil lectin protein
MHLIPSHYTTCAPVHQRRGSTATIARHRYARRLAALITFVACLLTAQPEPAHAGVGPDPQRIIMQDLCLNMPSPRSGSIVLMVSCNRTEFGFHSWVISEVEPGSFLIVNRQFGLCLEAAGFSALDGAAAMGWACHGGANQRWTLKYLDPPLFSLEGGGYELRNKHTNTCLDLRLSREWTAPYLWSCHGGREQRWLLVR